MRLVLICLLPFLLAGWYAVSGNLKNAYDGAFRINTEIYAKYNGGLESSPQACSGKRCVRTGSYPADGVHAFSGSFLRGLFALLTAGGLYGAVRVQSDLPKILLPRIHRGEERILDLLTEPGVTVHATETPVFSQKMMDLELQPQAACNAVSIP